MTNNKRPGTAYAADWVLPIDGPAIRRGAVAVEGGSIAWIGRSADLPPEWGRPEPCHGIMLPGLVNAHTHLQYSGFAALGRRRFASFEDWSQAFGRLYAGYDRAAWHADAREGARRATRSGTTVFAEIVTDPGAAGAVEDAGATGVEFFEAIGQTERVWRDGGRDAYLRWLDDAPGAVARGISPHAPYSLDGAVVTELCRIAAARGMRVHSHLGESAVEAAFYLRGDGSVLTEYSGLRDEFALVRNGGSGLTTGRYADSIGLLGPGCHVAHGVYLDRADRELLLRRHTRVALCPRSNAVTGLDEAPVAAYLREGHDVAVGTDSLASSPSLDLMADVAELAAMARRQGYRGADLDARLVHAATRGGARALGLASGGHGTLRVGGPADLAVFDVAAGSAAEAYAALTHEAEGRCTLTVGGGRVLHTAYALQA